MRYKIYLFIFVLLHAIGVLNAQKIDRYFLSDNIFTDSLIATSIHNNFLEARNSDLVYAKSIQGIGDVDPTAGIAVLNSNTGSFAIVRLDSNFNFKWAKNIGRSGETGYNGILGITIKNAITGVNASTIVLKELHNGNLLIYGTKGSQIADSFDFDPGPGQYYINALPTQDSLVSFLTLLDSNGNLLWAKTIVGTNQNVSNTIAIDNNDNIIISGYYKGTIDVDLDTSNTYNLICNGEIGVYTCMYNSNAQLIWAKTTTGTTTIRPTQINTDNIGNIYIVGNFADTANFNFDGGVTKLFSPNTTYNYTYGDEAYLQKLYPNGVLDFVYKYDGGFYTSSIAIDAVDNVYLTLFYQTVTHPDVFNINLTQSASAVGGYSTCLIKLTNNASYILHKDFYLGLSNIAIKNNRLFLSGLANSPVDLDPDSGVFITNSNPVYYYCSPFNELTLDCNFICGGSVTGYFFEPSYYGMPYILGIVGLPQTDMDPTNNIFTQPTVKDFIIKLASNHAAIIQPETATMLCTTDSLLVNCSINDTDTDYCYQLRYWLPNATSAFGYSTIDTNTGVLIYKPLPTNPCNTALVDTVYYTVADRKYNPITSNSYVVVSLPACACPNTAPIGNTDTTFMQCNPNMILKPLQNDIDADSGQVLKITNVLATAAQGNFSFTDTSITYTPQPNFVGYTTAQYIVCDNGTPSKCDTTNVTIQVQFCNAAPIARNDTIFINCQDSVFINPVGNDIDSNAWQTLQLTALLNTGLQGNAIISNQQILLTPILYFTGNTNLQYIVCDNDSSHPKCDTATIYLQIKGCNIPPIANTDYYSIPCKGTILCTPLNNDVDTDSNQTIQLNTIWQQPSKGTITQNGNSLQYTALPCSDGLDSIGYIICDNATQSKCDTGWIIITIANCNCNPPQANFSINKNKICLGKCIQVTDSSSNIPTNWQWYCVGAVQKNSTIQHPIFCFDQVGTFAISLIVSNGFGKDSITKTNLVQVLPNPILQITADTVVIENTILPIQCTGANSYNWSPSFGLSATNIYNPTAYVTDNITYFCTATDTNNCSSSASVHIDLKLKVFIPNAFSPNGDRLNDKFVIQMPAHKLYNLQIRNRLGQLVFSSNTVTNSWDGMLQNQAMNMDTYFYSLQWTDLKNKPHQHAGDLILVR
jgi:gliding motility-associated-like protein